MVRQDPFECLVSFIVSQNNHISRITSLVQKIRKEYGTLLAELEGVELYAFPTVAQLSEASATDFREMGQGYRANYLSETVKYLKEKGMAPLFQFVDCFLSLRRGDLDRRAEKA